MVSSLSGVSYQLRNNADNSNIGTPVVGDGNNINLPTGPLTATITFNVLSTIGTCNGVLLTQTATVTVNANPVCTIAADSSVCANATGKTASVADAGGGATYTWTVTGGTRTDAGGTGASSITYDAGAGPAVNISVDITDGSGCTCSGNTSVTVNANPSCTISADSSVCANATGKTASVADAGGGATYTWTVTGGTRTDGGGTGTNSITYDAGAGPTVDISVDITDGNGCTCSGNTSVTVNANPTVTVNSPTICASAGSATITASPSGTAPFHYVWTVPGGAADPGDVASFSASVAGTYSVVVTDANGCTGSGSGTLTINANPSDPASAAATPATICNGQNSTLSADAPGAGFILEWFSGSCGGTFIAGQAPSVSPSATTNYFVWVKNTTTNCVSNCSMVTVTVNDNPAAAITPDPAEVCAGGTLNMNGNPSGGSGVYSTHAWTGDTSPLSATNVVNPTFNTNTPGVYNLTYTVTDDNGCIGSDALSITVNANPTADAGGGFILCVDAADPTVGGAPTASGGSAPYTYAWTGTGATHLSSTTAENPTFDLSAAGPGTYQVCVEVTDDNGCVSAQDCADITVNELPTADAGSDYVLCENAADPTVGGAPTASGGTAPYTYAWTGTGAAHLSSTTAENPTFDVSAAGPGSYQVCVTVTDDNTCISAQDCATIDIGDPIADAGSNLTLCESAADPTVGGAPSATGGTPPYTYAWSGTGAAHLSSTTAENPTFDVSAAGPGSYQVCVTVTDDNGCISAQACATIDIGDPSADAGADINLCEDAADPTVGGSPTASGGTAPYTYAWTGSGAAHLSSITAPNPTFDVSAAGPGTYQACVVVTDDTGCVSVQDCADITINELPTADAGADQTVCDTDTVSLHATLTNESGNAWTTSGDGTFDDPDEVDVVYTPGPGDLAAGTVTITLTAHASLACTVDDADDMVVTFQTSPSADAGPDQTVCDTDTVALNGSASDYNGVTWTTAGDGSFDDDTSLTAVYTPGLGDVGAGAVRLTLTAHAIAPCAVDAADDMDVTIQHSPKADPDNDQTICEGDTVQLVGTTSNSAGCTWTTSGDGTFDDDTLLNAVYTPGSGDIAAGTVDLTLTCDPIAPCAVPAANFITITINPLPDDGLTVSATAAAVCSGAGTFVTVDNSEVGVDYQLRNDANDANIGAPVAGTGGTINLPTGPITAATTFNVFATNATTLCSRELIATQTITLLAGTAFTSHPADATAVILPGVGAPTATFSVTVVGATLVLQWQESTDGGANFANVTTGTGGTTTIYTTAALTSADTGKQFRCVALGACGPATSNTATLTVQDASGVSNEVEDGGPNGGDGNNDGIPDRLQDNVTSLPNSNGVYVTLVSSPGTQLGAVVAQGNPSPGDTPAGAEFPAGFLSFSINGVAAGGAATTQIILPAGATVNTYYKFGAEASNPTPHWYEFNFDGITGAEVNGNIMTLHFVDGLRGDDDLTANGVVKDPGAPATQKTQPAAQATPATAPTGTNVVLRWVLQSFFGFPICGLGLAMPLMAVLTGLVGMKITIRRQPRRR